MSDLEGTAKPLITNLMNGLEVTLGIVDQSLLARWAAKTVVLFNYIKSDSVVLDKSDTEQIASGAAPDGFHIRLGYVAEVGSAVDILATTGFVISVMEAAASNERAEKFRTGAPNSFVATMAIGHLAISVAGGPGFRNPSRWVNGGTLPLMVWPPTLAGLAWPPKASRISSRSEYEAFHEGLCTER